MPAFIFYECPRARPIIMDIISPFDAHTFDSSTVFGIHSMQYGSCNRTRSESDRR